MTRTDPTPRSPAPQNAGGDVLHLASRRSTLRMVGTYAAISLVPVLLLGLVLGWSYRAEARQRGVAEGSSEALLVARTAVEPRLNGRPLSQGLTPDEKASMQALVRTAVRDHNILRLRLRDLAGNVVYADDGSEQGQRARGRGARGGPR